MRCLAPTSPAADGVARGCRGADQRVSRPRVGAGSAERHRCRHRRGARHGRAPTGPRPSPRKKRSGAVSGRRPPGHVRCVSIGVPTPGRPRPVASSERLRRCSAPPFDAHKGRAGRAVDRGARDAHRRGRAHWGLGALRCGAGLHCTIAPRGVRGRRSKAKTIELMTAALPAQAVAATARGLAVGKQAVVVGRARD
jgi:hypothetical protein